MKLSLIGFMGSGKTSVSQQLAKKLGLNCMEMDWFALQQNGCADMAALFEKGGEILLRETEIELARDWRDARDVVISTGGGVVMNKIITDYLKENDGRVIFLHVPFETIRERIKIDTTPRPLFEDADAARDLYNFRLPLYKRYADIVVETEDKSIDEIVEIIMNLIKK